MSLINDVLKQVDQKPKINSQLLSTLLPASSSAEHTLALPKILFFCFSMLLVLVISIQTLSGKSIVNLLTSQSGLQANGSEALEDEMHISPALVKAASESMEINIKNSSLEDDVIDQKVLIDKPALKSKKETIKRTPEAAKPNIVVSAPHDSVSVLEVEDLAKQYYQKSLISLNSGNLQRSEKFINKAISVRADVEYLVLNARILIESKKPEEFYRFVTSYPEERELSWLKIVAPGLQIFSFSELSNQYYKFLIALEPNSIRWKLAVALNFLRLDEPRKAISIYQNLAVSDGISRQQANWLNKKIHQLQKVEG